MIFSAYIYSLLFVGLRVVDFIIFGEGALTFDLGANLLSSTLSDPSDFMTTSDFTLSLLVPVVDMCSMDLEIFLLFVCLRDRPAPIASKSSEMLPESSVN